MTLLVSCNKSDDHSISNVEKKDTLLLKVEIEKASIEEQIAYKDHHLGILGKWFSENHESTVEMFIQKQYEKDDNNELFFRDIVKEYSQNGKSLTTNEVINQAINAFSDLNGRNWEPVVFLIGNANRTTEKTFLAIESNTTTSEYFRGFEIINSKIHPLKTPLTEEFVGSNNLYVIELVRPSKSNKIDISAKNGRLILEKMKIKDLKESWPGRSEINFQGFKLNNPINAFYECGDYISGSANCNSGSGKRIVRLKRRWKNKNRSYNFLIKNNNNNGNDLIYYVIFEEDSFPALAKFQQFSLPNGGLASIKYRSWNSKYDSKLLTQSNANNYNASNGSIAYSFKLK